MKSSFGFRGVSVAVPAGCTVAECSDSQVLLAGAYDEQTCTQIEKDCAAAGLPVVIEFWGGHYRIRMPSGLPSEKNVVDVPVFLWQRRNPKERADVTTFGSSATFLLQGSVRSAGHPRRFVPDASISKFTKYFREVAKDNPKSILANGYYPDTVIEVRSPGNPRGELEEKAALMLSLGTQELFLIDGIEGLTKSFRLLNVGESENNAKTEEGPDRTVTSDVLEEMLHPEDMPTLRNVANQKIVTITDRNPTLLKSRVWPRLHFPIVPLKLDPLFWRPSLHFFQTDAKGLIQPFTFQVRVVLSFGLCWAPRLRW
jgi:Uma2 family endonuclease